RTRCQESAVPKNQVTKGVRRLQYEWLKGTLDLARGRLRPAALGLLAVSTAMMLRGIPYRNGGSDPSGFDCSGFVQWVFAQNGVRLPREVREQYDAGRRIDLREVIPGDLVFFETVSRGASHVGVAIGGDQFVHAPSSQGVVRVERFTANYWSMRFVGARMITTENTEAGATKITKNTKF